MQGPRHSIDLNDIDHCHQLDPITIAAYVVAARVCLSRTHDSPLFHPIVAQHSHDGASKPTLHIAWQQPDERMIATHDNDEDAARDGAYVIALVASYLNLGLRVVRRERTKRGFDWVARAEGVNSPQLIVVEVSGLLSGTRSSNPAEQRLRVKAKQISDGGSGVPGLAFVVDFRPADIELLSETVPESRTR